MASNGYQVIGGFSRRKELEDAVSALRKNSFSSDSVSVLISDTPSDTVSREAIEGDARDAAAAKGAATGAGTGAVVGGALGWLAGLGALAIPGFGPLIAAGPLAALAVGATAGGTLGGLSGALLGLGLSEDEAQEYEERFRQGEGIVSVACRDSNARDRASAILRKAGAKNVSAVERPESERTERRAARTQAASPTEISGAQRGSSMQRTASSSVESRTQERSLASQIEIDRTSIEKRAFEIWQREGCPPGREMEHWSRAEQELQAEHRGHSH